jgi:hypothetical protein
MPSRITRQIPLPTTRSSAHAGFGREGGFGSNRCPKFGDAAGLYEFLPFLNEQFAYGQLVDGAPGVVFVSIGGNNYVTIERIKTIRPESIFCQYLVQ